VNYRQLHEESLKQNRPEWYQQLQSAGNLQRHLDAVSQEAKELHQRLVSQLQAKQPYNPVEFPARETWEKYLNQVAREIVLYEVVLVKDQESEDAEQNGYRDPTTASPTLTPSEAEE